MSGSGKNVEQVLELPIFVARIASSAHFLGGILFASAVTKLYDDLKVARPFKTCTYRSLVNVNPLINSHHTPRKDS